MENITGNTVKKYLKENGIDTKGLSVSVKPCLYDESIKVTIKNKLTNRAQIEKLIRVKYSKIEYCKASGEILQGCNVYTFVNYDHNIQQEFYRTGQEFLQGLQEGDTKQLIEGYKIAYHDDRVTFLSNDYKQQKSMNKSGSMETIGEILTQGKISIEMY